jgi:hypothetical protein
VSFDLLPMRYPQLFAPRDLAHEFSRPGANCRVSREPQGGAAGAAKRLAIYGVSAEFR